MSSLRSLWLVGTWAIMAQGPPPPPDLQILADTGSDSTLIAQARAQPDDVREALRRLFGRAVSDSMPAGALAAAGRLAHTYAVAWRDSFLIRQVRRFESWSPEARRASVAADSIRRAGNAALGRAGVRAAMRAWRRSLQQCEALGDSAGIGAALGNIGAGFYRSGDLASATRYFERARAVARRIGDHHTEGNAVGALASVSADQGDLHRSAELYARATEIRALSGDDRGAAADRNNLGLVAQELGDLDAARRAFSEALAENRKAGRDEPAALNLINLGNLASLEGDYPTAAARYHEALALYRAQDNRVGVASVLHDLGLLDFQRGDYATAVSALVQALEIFKEAGPPNEEIAVRQDIASAHAAMGNLQGALIQLGRAEHLVGADRVEPQLLAQLALTRAELAVQFNRFAEAERHYALAGQLSRQAADGAGQAEAERGQALLYLLRGDYARADARLARAQHSQERLKDSRSAALTRLIRGYAQIRAGDTAGARGTLTSALEALRAISDPTNEAIAQGLLGDLALQEGRAIAAESLYRRGLDRLGAAASPTVSWQLHRGLAVALQTRRESDAAAEELRAATRDIERVSGAIPIEERRTAFLADKWEVYSRLAHVELDRGRTESAFEASERLRARQLLDLLARGRVATPGPGTKNDALAAREQDLRRQINTLTLALEGPEAASGTLRGLPAATASSAAVREALDQAQQAYADLLVEMQETRPQYTSLVTGRIAPVRAVMARIPRDEALLEYLLGDSTSIVFVVTTDTVAAIDLGLTRNELNGLVDFTRSILTRPGPGTRADSWRAPLRRLYGALIEPVEASGLLAGKRGLLIAPHAELHYVPFAALLSSASPEQYLIQRYRLTYTPSASVWLSLHKEDQARASGVLALSPRPEALPGSAAEVSAIGRLYGTRAHVLIGAQASERALREAAPGKAIIHLATYGVLNKENPLFSFVELMPDAGDDGRLEVHEVFGLHLRARLVVLSACQTAMGAGALADVPPGDDWVGLVQAFLFAGASNVMATLWPVQDQATADLMIRFYAALAAGRPEAEALAEAQRAMLRNPGTAHPFYWAGFTLSGGP
jgi:CHAT domain-containing protein/tetratricopeptide (TPR) repeat protein